MQEVRVYSLASEGNVQITPHFKVREFRCKDGGGRSPCGECG